MKLALNAIAYNTEAFNSLPLAGDEDLLLDKAPSLSDTFSQGVEQSLTSGLRSIAYIPAGSTNVQIDLNDNGANDDIQVFTTDGKPFGRPRSVSQRCTYKMLSISGKHLNIVVSTIIV